MRALVQRVSRASVEVDGIVFYTVFDAGRAAYHASQGAKKALRT